MSRGSGYQMSPSKGGQPQQFRSQPPMRRQPAQPQFSMQKPVQSSPSIGSKGGSSSFGGPAYQQPGQFGGQIYNRPSPSMGGKGGQVGIYPMPSYTRPYVPPSYGMSTFSPGMFSGYGGIRPYNPPASSPGIEQTMTSPEPTPATSNVPPPEKTYISDPIQNTGPTAQTSTPTMSDPYPMSNQTQIVPPLGGGIVADNYNPENARELTGLQYLMGRFANTFGQQFDPYDIQYGSGSGLGSGLGSLMGEIKSQLSGAEQMGGTGGPAQSLPRYYGSAKVAPPRPNTATELPPVSMPSTVPDLKPDFVASDRRRFMGTPYR